MAESNTAFRISETKMASPNRVLVLAPIEGLSPKSSTGLVDSRLFTGGNKLHAVMDTQTCLWSLKYEEGLVPQALRQQFTSFKVLYKFAEDYFKKRNIEIKEVLN